MVDGLAAWNGDPVPVEVIAVPGLDPRLVAGGLGVLLGAEAADPPGFADARPGIFGRDGPRLPQSARRLRRP
jgi:hypothetical protein